MSSQTGLFVQLRMVVVLTVADGVVALALHPAWFE